MIYNVAEKYSVCVFAEKFSVRAYKPWINPPSDYDEENTSTCKLLQVLTNTVGHSAGFGEIVFFFWTKLKNRNVIGMKPRLGISQ